MGDLTVAEVGQRTFQLSGLFQETGWRRCKSMRVGECGQAVPLTYEAAVGRLEMLSLAEHRDKGDRDPVQEDPTSTGPDHRSCNRTAANALKTSREW